MRIILSVLILIGLLSLFFQAELGLIGLLVLAVVVWNFIGSLYEYFGQGK